MSGGASAMLDRRLATRLAAVADLPLAVADTLLERAHRRIGGMGYALRAAAFLLCTRAFAARLLPERVRRRGVGALLTVVLASPVRCCCTGDDRQRRHDRLRGPAAEVTEGTADAVIVGSGFAGLLVARALIRAGRSVVVLERGGLRARVAGDDLPLFPRSGPLPQPAHALSPVDELAAEVLEPFGALPQARPSVAVGGRPACCGNTNCALCPVDARASMLHLLDDERLLEHPRLELRAGVAVERLQVERDRVTALDCVDRRRRRSTVEASRVVLAAGCLENPAILLRSGLDGEHVGRWLFDHGHRLVHLQLDRTAGSGRGATHVTGASWAYADGPWRDRSGSQLVLPFNQGLLGTRLVRDAIVAGDGRSRPLRERVERTLVFDVLGEELPLPERRIELPRRRDRLGLPRTRIHYPGDSAYLQTARSRLAADLERRFGRYGARVVAVERAGEGSHQLGTCFMGERDGVVDADLRHHRYENLFVAGRSAFPSYSTHHPTLTICAPALRLGRHLLSSS